jgi:uncharacterized membrane protein YhaH (DUF805 family)
MGYMFLPLKRYADFNGRSRRMEFWMWTLFNSIIAGILVTILLFAFFDAASRSTIGYSRYSTGSSYQYRAEIDPIRFVRNLNGLPLVAFGLLCIWGLIAFIPGLAVTIRRLHDTDKSGWFYFISWIPIVGPFILLFFLFSEGTRGPNRFGADPKDPYGQLGGGYGGYPPVGYGGHPPQPYGGPPGQPYGAPPPYGGHPGGPPYGGPGQGGGYR